MILFLSKDIVASVNEVWLTCNSQMLFVPFFFSQAGAIKNISLNFFDSILIHNRMFTRVTRLFINMPNVGIHILNLSVSARILNVHR